MSSRVIAEARDLRGLSRREESVRDAALVEHFDGARGNSEGTRAGELLIMPALDDGDVHARQRQFACEHEPCRSTTGDQYGMFGHSPLGSRRHASTDSTRIRPGSFDVTDIAFIPMLHDETMQRHPCVVTRHDELASGGRSTHSAAREEVRERQRAASSAEVRVRPPNRHAVFPLMIPWRSTTRLAPRAASDAKSSALLPQLSRGALPCIRAARRSCSSRLVQDQGGHGSDLGHL